MRPLHSLLVLLAAASPGAATAQDRGDRCDGSTTPEINACLTRQLATAEAEMDRYLLAATRRYLEAGEHATVLGLDSAQAAFRAYREIECGAVRHHWRDGTIRTANALVCSIALTDQRTHAIWRNWLTYPDSTPPDLPEPAPTL